VPDPLIKWIENPEHASVIVFRPLAAKAKKHHASQAAPAMVKNQIPVVAIERQQ
jgi:hypothetical protein